MVVTLRAENARSPMRRRVRRAPRRFAALGLALLSSVQIAKQGYASEPAPVIAHLAEAVRFQTVSSQDLRSDSESFDAFLRFLRSTYPRIFRELRVEEVSGHSLLLQWTGQDPGLRPVLFEGHYDVVPIEDGTFEDWTHPPFAGAIADGYVWGRGAVDDKAGVIGLFESVESLLADGFRPQRSLLFAVGHDEEIRGLQGARKIAAMLEARGVELEYVVGEGGGLFESYPLLPSATVATIGLAQKAYLTMHLSLEGEGGHSSMPRAGSALVRLAAGLARLDASPFEARLVSPVTDMFEALGPHVGGIAGFLMERPRLAKPILLRQLAADPAGSAMVRTTTAVTMFNAGVKENVVPQRAIAVVNFRLMPWDTPEAVEERVRAIIDLPELRIRSDFWGESPPVADAAGPGYARIAAAVASVAPDAVVIPSLLVPVTDSRHFAGLTANIYHFRPWTIDVSEASSIHGTNERVSVAGVERSVAIYRDLLRRVAAP